MAALLPQAIITLTAYDGQSLALHLVNELRNDFICFQHLVFFICSFWKEPQFVRFSRLCGQVFQGDSFPSFHFVSSPLGHTTSEPLLRIQDSYSRLLGDFSIPSPLPFDQKRNILVIPEYQQATLLIPVVFNHVT